MAVAHGQSRPARDRSRVLTCGSVITTEAVRLFLSVVSHFWTFLRVFHFSVNPSLICPLYVLVMVTLLHVACLFHVCHLFLF